MVPMNDDLFAPWCGWLSGLSVLGWTLLLLWWWPKP